MPAISKGSKILVTGANGFVAMWVVRTLLEHGYSVRGTVRSQDKGQFMTDYFEKLGFGANFEFVIVEDMLKDGAFDEAVKGVDGIEHTASPFSFNVKDPQELIGPAVQGTVGLFQSTLKYGTQVKRIVMTSSVVAIMDQLMQPGHYTEKNWNTASIKEVEEMGDKSTPIAIYSASKTLAERAAWEFYEKHKAGVMWDLVTINPTYIFGPPIHEIKSLSSLNTSLQVWYDIVTNDTPRTKQYLEQTIAGWVDVRDTALGHVLALEKEEAGGERIITCAESYNWQEWLNIVNSLDSLPSGRSYPKGYSEITADNVSSIVIDTSKEQRILGIKYKTKLETTQDSMEFFTNRGW